MNPNLIGLYVGAAASLIFLAVSFFYYQKVPSLNQVAVVLLAWAGAVVGIHLGYLSLTADDNALGKIGRSAHFHIFGCACSGLDCGGIILYFFQSHKDIAIRSSGAAKAALLQSA